MMKRMWAMPTFEIHGLVGGYTGPGVKTDRAAARGAQGDRPPGAGHEGRKGGPPGQGLREEAQPRRDGGDRLQRRRPTRA